MLSLLRCGAPSSYLLGVVAASCLARVAADGVALTPPDGCKIRLMTQLLRPVWVEILTTQEVVALGLRTILETAAGPFDITTTGPAGDDPDVVLYDVIHMRDGDDSSLEYWLKETASTVIAIDRTLRPELGAAPGRRASSGPSTWASPRDQLVAVIRDAIEGNLEDNAAAQEWERRRPPRLRTGAESARVGRARTGHPGAEQPGDRRDPVLEHQLGEDLHPQQLPQDGRRNQVAGRVWAIQHGFPAPELPDSPTDIEGVAS